MKKFGKIFVLIGISLLTAGCVENRGHSTDYYSSNDTSGYSSDVTSGYNRDYYSSSSNDNNHPSNSTYASNSDGTPENVGGYSSS